MVSVNAALPDLGLRRKTREILRKWDKFYSTQSRKSDSQKYPRLFRAQKSCIAKTAYTRWRHTELHSLSAKNELQSQNPSAAMEVHVGS